MRGDEVGAPILDADWLYAAQAIEGTAAELKQLSVIGGATFRIHY